MLKNTQRAIITLLILVLSFFAIAQNERKIFKEVKNENKSIYNLADSCVLVSLAYYNRFRQDTTRMHESFYLQKLSKRNFRYLSARLYGTLIFENNYLTLISMVGDTLPIKNMGNVSLDKYHNSSYYHALTSIPTVAKGDFSLLRYTKFRIEGVSNDTITLCQWDRQLHEYRYLTLDTNNRIIRIKNENYDLDRSDAGFVAEFKYFSHNCFDSLNQEYKIGPYSKKTVFQPKKIVDFGKPNSDTLWLLDGTYKIKSDYDFIILDYWYLSCAPCIQMQPFIQELHENTDSNKVLLLGVNTHDKKEDINRYFNRKGLKIPQIDATKNLPPFSFEEYPTTLILDNQLRIIKTYKGYGGKFTDRLITKYLDDLNLLR